MMAPNQASDDTAAQLALTDRYLAHDPSNAQLLARALDLAVALGAYDKAQGYLDAGLAATGADSYFRFRQAELLSTQGRWKEAEPVYADLLRVHQDVNIAYGLARARAHSGDHDGCIEVLWPLRDAPELPAQAGTQLVRSLHHAGRGNEALSFASQSGQRFAADPSFCAAASLAAFDENDVDAATRFSRQAQANGSAPLEALVVDGSLALERLDLASAFDTFERALAMRPDEGRSLAGLGSAYLVRREFDRALPILESAHRAMPTHIGTLHLLAWCRLFLGDVEGAQRDFHTALEIDRNFADSHGGLAIVHALRGNRTEAEGEIALAIRLDRAALSARYARMILDGDAADPGRFGRLADRVLEQYTVNGGTNASQLRQYRGE